MIYEILDANGAVANCIEATESFVEQQHPGAWRLAEVQDVPTPPTPATPTVCSPAQGLVALFAIKQITESDVNATIAAITDPVLRYTTQIAFARATEWRRDSASIQQLAALLGLTESDLDALFAFAVTVAV